jgi:adenine-specific DNA-methyltransferase
MSCLSESERRLTADGDTPLRIVAVEIDDAESDRAIRRIEEASGLDRVDWIRGDFFSAYEQLKATPGFDAVVGNPPFIRFQSFREDSRDRAFLHLREVGYSPSKLANAWAAFVALCIELIREGGRMAMVVPAELLQVKYASELRAKLTRAFDHIIVIGFRKLVFPEIQQEVVLLLAEGRRRLAGPTSDIQTLEFDDGSDLVRGNLDDAIRHVPSKHARNGMKWTSLFLSEPAFAALDDAQRATGLTKLGALGMVDVGIVTGRNSFFVLSKAQRESMGILRYTVRTVGRTSALKSLVFGQDAFARYESQHPAYILNLSGVAEDALPSSVKDYICRGEAAGVHTGFKCRTRPRWYDVPSVYVPGGFLFRQVHRYPMLVANEAGATSTDTIHRVRFRDGVNPRLLAASFFNSLTFAWAEVSGRSYGGGVLELEPSEAEDLPIPYHANLDLDPNVVDSLVSSGREDAALDYVDGVVLRDYLGLDRATIRRLRTAWSELRNRRNDRKRPAFEAHGQLEMFRPAQVNGARS